MLAAGLAQLRFTLAVATGRPIPGWALDRLITATVATWHEFGAIGEEGAAAVAGPILDAETQREIQLRRFRTQARRAAAATDYYGRLFAEFGRDPAKLTWADVARLPLTPKTALQERPDAFVRRDADPILRTTTTGTTGRPTQVAFSAAELRTMIGLVALGSLLTGHFCPDDVVVMATSSRAVLGNLGLAGACARIGALLLPVGQVAPDQTLALLAQPLAIPGKKPRPSYLSAYPSYLGALVDRGLALGYGPRDFGLERIVLGGEVVTAGLLTRARRLFGDVAFGSSYGMTETLPFGGTQCEHGHLHFAADQGLLEVLDPETGLPAAPVQPGNLVATPFPPFRETTLLLRYDTEDVARPLTAPPTCNLRHQPAVAELLGKRRLAVRHDLGWTYPREVLEALEAVESVPLPARCGFWAVPGGIAVEVVVREEGAAGRRAVERGLAERGVPVRELRLVRDRLALRHPFPLRGDLAELSFRAPAPVASSAA